MTHTPNNDDWLDRMILGLQDWASSKGKIGIEPAVAKQAIQAHIKQIEIEAKYEVLQDLLDWHNQWFNTHDKDDQFNWYGAVKAMLVMQEPRKPFVELAPKHREGE